MKDPSSISLPRGVRDILPEEAERIYSVENTIIDVFHRQGFKRVITPLVEYVDVLSRGLDERLKEKLFKFIDPLTGRVVAIRPDITPQIARIVATKMRTEGLPLKLYYNENIFRNSNSDDSSPVELLQIGAEYISDEALPEIDAQMITMAMEILERLGIEEFRIDIGEMGFVKAIMASLDVPQATLELIKDAIAKKDSGTLKEITGEHRDTIGEEREALLLSLTELYGDTTVVDRALECVKDEGLREHLLYVKKVVDIVGSKGFADKITIDLGEVRGFAYYTGIIFECFCGRMGSPVLSGGRYDNLMASYGYDVRSTGFAFDVAGLVTILSEEV